MKTYSMIERLSEIVQRIPIYYYYYYTVLFSYSFLGGLNLYYILEYLSAQAGTNIITLVLFSHIPLDQWEELLDHSHLPRKFSEQSDWSFGDFCVFLGELDPVFYPLNRKYMLGYLIPEPSVKCRENEFRSCVT